MTVLRWPNVRMGPTGELIAGILEFYPGRADIYITSGMDGLHGATSHHYGLVYLGSPTAALDVGGGGVTAAGSAKMRDFALWVYTTFPGECVELIHTTPFADHGFYIRHGVKLPDGGGVYSADTMAKHVNHVHLAMSEAGALRVLANLRASSPAPKPMPIPAPLPRETMTLVDIASYQVGLDLAVVKAAGFDAVNIKTSQGNWYRHPRAVEWAGKARALGLTMFTFHWLDASTSGAAQARIAFDVMKAMGGPVGMGHQADSEDDGQKYGPLTFAIWRDYVNAMQDLLGRPICNYTGDWWWQAKGRNWQGADVTPYLWAAPNSGYLAGYPGDDSPHWQAGYGGWGAYAGLQYAVRPLANSGDGNLSMSAFRDPAAWAALTGAAAPSNEEDDDMEFLAKVKDDGTHFLANGWGIRGLPSEGAVIFHRDILGRPVREFANFTELRWACGDPVVPVDGGAVPGLDEVKAAMADAAFEGAQRAERE